MQLLMSSVFASSPVSMAAFRWLLYFQKREQVGWLRLLECRL